MKKQLHFAFVFLVFLMTSCATDKLEVQENYTTNSENVWAYDGNNSVLKRVIQELKSGSQRESLERKLAKNEVLWENARFTFIDNKKWILVPFLSEDQENVIGVLTLVKNDKGKTTADMTVRTRMFVKNNKLPFWDKGNWLGYFMALDKDILGIKNGNPGFKTIRNPKSLAQRIECDPYVLITTYYQSGYSVSPTGEVSYYGTYETSSNYEYYPNCYEVPDNPVTTPTPGTGDDGSGGGGGGNPLQIYNYLIDKEKCLNGLLDLKGESYMQKLLANFEGVSKFNLKIASKDIVTVVENGIIKELNGKTSYVPGSNLITIEISTTRINNLSSLESARIILHEYVHADIFRKLNTQTETNQEILDFKNTYNDYENQHGIMAGLYINNMKETLKNFHKNVLADDYNKYVNYYGEAPSDAFYEALAWGGLKENNIKAWNDLPQERKDAINSFSNRILILSKTNPCKQ